MFYGLPIHIIHNLFLTARSFMKRLAAFIKYRRATHDMNSRYEDATVEDIQREDTCIICREEMRPWSVTNPQALPAEPGALPPARPPTTVNERSRPKKLPCGHILHLGCLKSWLERQQVCPTCRRPVVDAAQAQTRGAANNANPAGQGAQAPRPDQQDGAGAQPPAAGGGNRRRLRVLNLGPLRVGFGQANLQDLAQDLGAAEAGQMGMSLSIASALSTVALAWMSTKASPFGTLVARGEYKTLDQLFFRTLWQSSCLLAVGTVTLLLCIGFVTRNYPHLAVRVLPLPVFGILLATIFCNHFVFCEAFYLRAHAREPFLTVSIVVGVLTACSTIFLGKLWGAQGVTIGYFCTSGVFGFAFGTYLFITKRRQWHTAPSLEGSSTL